MAGQLAHVQRVFQGALSGTGGKQLPAQFLYSTAAHGAEEPADEPDPLAKGRACREWPRPPQITEAGAKPLENRMSVNGVINNTPRWFM